MKKKPLARLIKLYLAGGSIVAIRVEFRLDRILRVWSKKCTYSLMALYHDKNTRESQLSGSRLIIG